MDTQDFTCEIGTFGPNSGTSVALLLYVNKLHDICFVTVMTKHIQLHNWTDIIIETHWFCRQEMFGSSFWKVHKQAKNLANSSETNQNAPKSWEKP